MVFGLKTAVIGFLRCGEFKSLASIHTLGMTSALPKLSLPRSSAEESQNRPWQAVPRYLSDSSSGSQSPSQTLGLRLMSSSHLVPRFIGGKIKPYSSYKQRFKLTGGQKIRFMKPGYVHKRYNKSTRRLFSLSKTEVVHNAYAVTMKKLGFSMRHF